MSKIYTNERHTEIKLFKVAPEKLVPVLGLPFGSVISEYDVFRITDKGNNSYVFKSTVSGTEQFANETPTLKYLSSGWWNSNFNFR